MFLQNVGMFMGPLPDIINVDITVLIVHLDFRQSLVSLPDLDRNETCHRQQSATKQRGHHTDYFDHGFLSL